MKYTKQELEAQLDEVLALAVEGAIVTGAKSRLWYHDQIIRVITGDRYEEFVEYCAEGNFGGMPLGWGTGAEPEENPF